MTQCTCRWLRLAACAKAGCVYALSVFAVGFVLGAMRVLLLAPRVGDTAAVVLEAPVMLAVSWKMSRWSASRYGLQTDPGGALLMGAIAFAVLMLAELATAVLFFNRTAAAYVAGFWSVSGAIGLAAQLCFAGFPFVQAGSSRIESSG